jgi:imidazole glycerol-phosphate synthase subunit HisH
MGDAVDTSAPTTGPVAVSTVSATGGARPSVVVLDYGSGNIRSAVRMLERVGADVELTAEPDRVLAADGLFVPGVGNFHACMEGLRAVHGPALIERRLAGGRPVLGVCVGMQVMFEGSSEPSSSSEDGLGEWPGLVDRLPADVVPHMGWNTVSPPAGTHLFAGVEDQRFYFVHSYAAQHWTLSPHGPFEAVAPVVTWSEHGAPFIAAVENGPLCATQFHPEKSGDAGARLLANWLATL